MIKVQNSHITITNYVTQLEHFIKVVSEVRNTNIRWNGREDHRTIGVAKNKIETISEIEYPNSLGLFTHL